MPNLVVVPRSPVVPRTAELPHSHEENSTRAGLDQLGLTALRQWSMLSPTALVTWEVILLMMSRHL